MGKYERKRANAEKNLRRVVAGRRADVVKDIARKLEAFPCPVCHVGRKVTVDFRLPRHDYRAARCRGSLLAVGWFEDGLAAIPYDRYDDPASREARARLKRALSPVKASDRRSTAIVGDRSAPSSTVSGGLPGSKR